MRRQAIRNAFVLLALALAPCPGEALPASVDADHDGVVDAVETALGANPDDAASTPESLAVPPTCLDGKDDDLDGATDGNDPGCHLSGPSDGSFPPAGDDVFEATLSFPRFPLDTPFGVCSISISARGPVVVRRSDPSPADGSPREVDLEVVALQVDGTAEFHADPGLPDCLLPPSTFDITLFEDPAQASTGKLTDDDEDPALDFPAAGFLDLYFDVAWGFDKMTVLPGGPEGGPAGAPLRLENRIHTLPAYLGRNPLCWASSHDELCPAPPPGSYLCYEGNFHAPGFEKSEVQVQEDFEPEGVEQKVRKPSLYCAPASPDGEPVYDPVGHLACYKLEPRKTGAPLFWKSKLLCRAAKRSQEGLSLELPTILDDYACYEDKGTDRFGAPFERRPIAVTDAFGTVATDVIAPKLRCNPAGVDGAPTQNPLRALECFKLAPKRVREEASLFDRIGQFVESVTTSRAVSLCVPTAWEKTALH